MSIIRSIEQLVEQTPTPVSHVTGVGSGLTGLALWAGVAQHLTMIGGLFVTFLAGLGAVCYVGYWALKFYAKYKRIRRGDYTE